MSGAYASRSERSFRRGSRPITTRRSCADDKYDVKKHDACEKSHHGNVNRSRGYVRRAGRSAACEIEAVDEPATALRCAALHDMSSSGGKTHDVSAADNNKPVGTVSHCCLPEKKMDMQSVSAALPLVAKEARCTETKTESCNTPAIASKLQAQPSRRLFQVSVQTIRDNMVQSVEKTCSKTELAFSSQSEDGSSSSRRTKRCKLSTYACDSFANITEHGASRHSAGNDEQFVHDINKDSSSIASVSFNKSEKKEHIRREKAACSQAAQGVVVTKQVPLFCVKGKQNEQVCPTSTASVEMIKDLQRSSNGRGDMALAVAESQYNLRSTHHRCDPYATSSSVQPSAKKSSRKNRSGRRKSESVSSYEADLKLSDSEKKSGENQLAKSSQKDRRSKNRRNVEKLKVEDENKKIHEADMKFNDSKKIVDDNKTTRSAQEGSRFNVRRLEHEDDATKKDDFFSRSANQTGQNLLHSVHDHKPVSTSQSFNRGSGSARGKTQSFRGNQRQSSALNMQKHGAARMDDCHKTHAGGIVSWQQGKGSLSAKPVRRLDAQHSFTKQSRFKNSSDNARIAEDWETELLVFLPPEQSATVSSENIADVMGELCCVEETVTTSTCESYTAVTDGGSTSESIAEVFSRPLQQPETSMDHHDNDNSTTSGEVNTGFKHGSEQIHSELYSAEKFVDHAETFWAKETSQTSISLKHIVDVVCEIDIPMHDEPPLNCGKPDVDKPGHSFTDDRQEQREISESSNMLSVDAEQYEHLTQSDEIVGPYEIGADDFVLSQQSDKHSDEISNGVGSVAEDVKCTQLSELLISDIPLPPDSLRGLSSYCSRTVDSVASGSAAAAQCAVEFSKRSVRFCTNEAASSNSGHFPLSGKSTVDQSLAVREQSFQNPDSSDVEKTSGGTKRSTDCWSLVAGASSQPPSTSHFNPLLQSQSYCTWHTLSVAGSAQQPTTQKQKLPPVHVTSEHQPATAALQWPAVLPTAVASKQSELQPIALHAENSFDLNSGFQTMELVSPASMSKAANKNIHKHSQPDDHSKDVSKPLFAVQGFRENIGRVQQDSAVFDENQNKRDSWKDAVADLGKDLPVTHQNSDGNFDSALPAVLPPCCLFSALNQPPLPLSSTSHLCVPSSLAPNVSRWQTATATGTICHPQSQFTPVFLSPPPPPPPVTSSRQLSDSGASWSPYVPPAVQLYSSPPPVYQQTATNRISWPFCPTRMLQPAPPVLPPPPPPPPVMSVEQSPMETSWNAYDTVSPLAAVLHPVQSPPFTAASKHENMATSKRSSWSPLLQQPPPPTSKTAKHSRLQDAFISTARFQTVERGTVAKGIKKMPQCLSRGNHDRAGAKPLFEIRVSNDASGMDDDDDDNDDNVPASWEDIEDSEFPQLRPSAAVAASSECCSDSTATSDWFDVQPGQLEASKWSMTFHKQVATPPVRSTGLVPRTALSFSAPAAPRSGNTNQKQKKMSLNLYRPGTTDDEDSELMADWSLEFKTRYETVITPYYDSHCHLDFLFKRTGFRGSFAKYRDQFPNTFPSNFAGCVAVFCNPAMWTSHESEGSLFRTVLRDKLVWGAVGCHPKSVNAFDDDAEMKLRRMLRHERIVALGEIGLDYSGEFSEHSEEQKTVLRRQVAIAMELNLPVVIHSRDSEHDIIKELEKLLPRNYRIHRHCFTGNWREGEHWLQKFPSSYIGVTPLVTMRNKRAADVRDFVKHVPLDRLLLETDSPYFIPSEIPYGEMRYSHPGLAITVARTVAELRNISVEEVLAACYENTRHMYNI